MKNVFETRTDGMSEEERQAERFTERPAQRGQRMAAKRVSIDDDARIRRALGI